MRRWFFILFLFTASWSFANAWGQAGVTGWNILTAALQLSNAGPALPAFLQKSARQGSDPAFVYGVLQEAQQLNARGLPVDPYLLKANEGLAKGIAPSRIRPALEDTRRRTELAETLVNEAQARGLVFSHPGQRRMAIQKYQWALMNQTPPAVLRDLPPGHVKKPKDYNKMGPKGPKGRGWGQGKNPHGKFK